MMNIYATTISKREDRTTNEDAVRAEKGLIAVSDGAGGGGIFADRWSKYLLENLPKTPFSKYEQTDSWLDKIWEPYYDTQEAEAKRLGSMVLNKLYDEGSFATLAAAWQTQKNLWRWAAYGDSVVFHYQYDTHKLEHSFTRLADFAQPPYLVSCKDPMKKEGFRAGSFRPTRHSAIFAASDALSHYILMMYCLSCGEERQEEIDAVAQSHSRNAQLVRNAACLAWDAEIFQQRLHKLFDAARNERTFADMMTQLERDGLLGHDDYSLAVAIEENC